MDSILTAALFIIIFIGLVVAIYSGGDIKESERLKKIYNEALKGSDKRAALNSGRAYYSALRKRKGLTVYDEAAIFNDLSTMDLHIPPA